MPFVPMSGSGVMATSRRREAPKKLAAVTAAGDRRASLEALRQKLAAAIDEVPPARDLAALSRQLTSVMAEIDALAPAVEGNPLDELRNRRAARDAAAG
jgi:hypothetical protein